MFHPVFSARKGSPQGFLDREFCLATMFESVSPELELVIKAVPPEGSLIETYRQFLGPLRKYLLIEGRRRTWASDQKKECALADASERRSCSMLVAIDDM